MTARHVVRALLVLTALAASASAEEPAAAQAGEKAMGCQQMMQKEKEEVAALESKTAAMNAAQGADKLDAIAAVVNELVVQHRAMHGGRSCPGDCPMMGAMGEKMQGMMGGKMDHGTMEQGTMEHGTMPHDAPAPPSGGTTP
jgi:hypothetical protein